jgi:chaperonin GroEL (HSP60 family)
MNHMKDMEAEGMEDMEGITDMKAEGMEEIKTEVMEGMVCM